MVPQNLVPYSEWHSEWHSDWYSIRGKMHLQPTASGEGLETQHSVEREEVRPVRELERAEVRPSSFMTFATQPCSETPGHADAGTRTMRETMFSLVGVGSAGALVITARGEEGKGKRDRRLEA